MANHKDINSLSINKDARAMIARAREEGIETVWDRLAAQKPQCGYCAMGVSCRNCAMGPCRVDPFGEGPQKGVCGADADIIVARNLAVLPRSGQLDAEILAGKPRRGTLDTVGE